MISTRNYFIGYVLAAVLVVIFRFNWWVLMGYVLAMMIWGYGYLAVAFIRYKLAIRSFERKYGKGSFKAIRYLTDIKNAFKDR